MSVCPCEVCMQLHKLTCSYISLHGVTWASCRSMSLHAVQWAYMKFNDLTWSFMSLYAVPFFVWAAHKNFAVLVGEGFGSKWFRYKSQIVGCQRVQAIAINHLAWIKDQGLTLLSISLVLILIILFCSTRHTPPFFHWIQPVHFQI